MQHSTPQLSQIPIIDISGLVSASAQESSKRDAAAAQISQACREHGFFYVVGHGVSKELQQRLEQLSRQFFDQDLDTKMQIRMALGGRAWRGYFPVGGELTSGKPDLKEGIYFGSELNADHPSVKAEVPMHGANLFPSIPHFRETVLDYIEAMTRLGHTLMSGIALSLGLEPSYFYDRYTSDPLVLFRIFNYPGQPSTATTSEQWGVGEHTDYGILTILKQDDRGGLQVKSKSRWLDAPPIPDSFICNIGDMLDRMTRGLYRSTPHRVRNSSGRDRLSFPFFFDPNFDVEIQPIETIGTQTLEDDRNERWDKASVHQFHGTYGDYVIKKVSNVFPELQHKVL